VHRGPEPPEVCPVCGASKSDFEPYSEEPAAAPREEAGQWKCMICGYTERGAGAPRECPVCGAHGDRFERAAEGEAAAGEAATGAGKGLRAVILGGGIAGVSAAESVRGALPEASITLIAKEARLPYYRLNLTRYLAGEIGEETLPIHPEEWYRERSIEVVLEGEASALDVEQSEAVLRGGDRVEYDKLIVAVGAHPFIPPVPGAAREGVFALRTVEDAERILELAKPGASCVCIGGGILGIETAGALAGREVEVTLLESFPWLMPRQLNRRAGALLEKHMNEIGITLHTGATTKEIAGDERVSGVVLSDGSDYHSDFVVLATGVRPNSHLARRAGLDVKNGIVVNNHLQTSHPDVYAAGDVAEHRGILYGTWGPAQYQGSIAGLNAGGSEAEFGGIPRSNTVKVLGVDVWSIGEFEPQDGSYEAIEEETEGGYYCFVFRDTVLVGSILFGDAGVSSQAKKAIENREDFSGLLRGRPSASEVAAHLAETAR